MLFAIGIGAQSLGLLLHIIGIATTRWITGRHTTLTTSGNSTTTEGTRVETELEIGLFKFCFSEICLGYDHYGTYEILRFHISGVARLGVIFLCMTGIVLSVVGFLIVLCGSVCFTSRSSIRTSLPVMLLCILAGVSTFGGVILFSQEIYHELLQRGGDFVLGYSFILCICGGILFVAGGILIFLGRSESACCEKRVGEEVQSNSIHTIYKTPVAPYPQLRQEEIVSLEQTQSGWTDPDLRKSE